MNEIITFDGISHEILPFTELLGKTLTQIDRNILITHGDTIHFTADGERYLMVHLQDCCESVWIEDICGDLKDLLDSPILLAEEVSSSEYDDVSYTWTFYKLATVKGYVTIRWYGTSNGYYSERVSFLKQIRCN